MTQISTSQVFKAMQAAGVVAAFTTRAEAGDLVIIAAPNKRVRSGLLIAIDADAGYGLVLIRQQGGSLKARWCKRDYLSVDTKAVLSPAEAQLLAQQSGSFF